MSKPFKVVHAISSNRNDHWMNQFVHELSKKSVESKSQGDLYKQIVHIMNNTKPRFSSIEDVVSDMQERAGVKNLLQKQAEENTSKLLEPQIIIDNPKLKELLKNYIAKTLGSTSVPAVVSGINQYLPSHLNKDELKSPECIAYIFNLIKEQKLSQPAVDDNYHQIGDLTNDEIDPSNDDMFISLLPATK